MPNRFWKIRLICENFKDADDNIKDISVPGNARKASSHIRSASRNMKYIWTLSNQQSIKAHSEGLGAAVYQRCELYRITFVHNFFVVYSIQLP